MNVILYARAYFLQFLPPEIFKLVKNLLKVFFLQYFCMGFSYALSIFVQNSVHVFMLLTFRLSDFHAQFMLPLFSHLLTIPLA